MIHNDWDQTQPYTHALGARAGCTPQIQSLEVTYEPKCANNNAKAVPIHCIPPKEGATIATTPTSLRCPEGASLPGDLYSLATAMRRMHKRSHESNRTDRVMAGGMPGSTMVAEHRDRNIIQDHRLEVAVPPPLSSITTEQASAYSIMSSQEHAYWFCVYPHAKPHEEVEQSRMSENRAEATHAATELSRMELSQVAEVATGLEVIQHHRPQETLGCVIDVFYDNTHHSLYMLVRPYDTLCGRNLASKVEFRTLRECSLAHARAGPYVQLHELSLCMKGARDGTCFIKTVLVADEPRPPCYPRMFAAPPFVIRASREKENHKKQEDADTSDITIKPRGRADHRKHIARVRSHPYRRLGMRLPSTHALDRFSFADDVQNQEYAIAMLARSM